MVETCMGHMCEIPETINLDMTLPVHICYTDDKALTTSVTYQLLHLAMRYIYIWFIKDREGAQKIEKT